MILVLTGLWFFNSPGRLSLPGILGFCVILIVVVFAIFIGFRKLNGTIKGEPAEDELSKKILRKTSSLSFYISLYLWLAIMYFSEKLEYETHTYIAAGILGMALIFAICWLIINFTGVKNE